MSCIKKSFVERTRTRFFVGVFFAALFFFHASADAATLSLSPSSGTYTIGKTFSVKVLVSSGGQSINAVAGQLTFSANTLLLTSISKGSLVNLWAKDPSYSNTPGSASFQGVILSGYNGTGTVVTLNFKARAAGTGTVSFSGGSSSVLLNNGQGTNVLSSTSGASFSIEQAAPTKPVAPPVVPVQPIVPIPVPVIPIPTVVIPMAAPLFTDYQSPLSPGDFVVVKGTATANTFVTVTFTRSNDNGNTSISQAVIPVMDNGTFAYISDEKVNEGSTYTLVASTSDGQQTQPLVLTVKNSLWFNVSSAIASLLVIKISAALALLIIFLITLYFIIRNSILKKRLRTLIDQLRDTQPKV